MQTPDRSEDLTFEWLQENTPHENSICKLDSFELDRSFGAPSANGEIVRVELNHSDQACGPGSMVIKFPNLDGPGGTKSSLGTMYPNELANYKLLSNHSEFAVPKLFSAHEGYNEKHIVLLLEDMSPAKAGSQVDGGTVEQSKSVLGQIAEIHRQFWGADYLSESPSPEQIVGVYGPPLKQGIGLLETRWQEEFDKTMSTWQWLDKNLSKVIAHQQGQPSTLIHGDLHAENILFTGDSERPSVIIDWQLSARGVAAHDVSHFLVGNISVENRKTHETDLLHEYYVQLTANTDIDYSFDEFFLDYRASICRSLVRPAFGYARADRAPNPEEIYPVADANFRRMNAAIQDLDPVGAMEELGY